MVRALAWGGRLCDHACFMQLHSYTTGPALKGFDSSYPIASRPHRLLVILDGSAGVSLGWALVGSLKRVCWALVRAVLVSIILVWGKQ